MQLKPLSPDQINAFLNKDSEWQKLVARTHQIDQNLLRIQQELQRNLDQITKVFQLNKDGRHIIPQFEEEESDLSLSNSQDTTPDLSKQKSSESNNDKKFEIFKIEKYEEMKPESSGSKTPPNLSKSAHTPSLTRSYNINSQYTTISERFQIGKFLGRGKFSDVFQAQDKASKAMVALKVIQKQVIAKYKMEQQLAHEIKIQTYLNHQNILKLYGCFQEQHKVVLILEYACEGELYKYLKRQPKKRFTEQQASTYIRQIIEGINYMHIQNVIHRDLKPENILISHQLLKIADMGLSTYNPSNQVRQSFCGTVDYMSPEIASGREYDHTVDIWSIGILAFELVTGQTPFYESNKEATMKKIVQGQIDFPSYTTEEFRNFIRDVVQKDAKKRMNIMQMSQHPWVQKYEKEGSGYNRELLNQIVKILK